MSRRDPTADAATRGTIELLTRVTAADLPTLPGQLTPGTRVEIILSPDPIDDARQHLDDLLADGIHVRLIGTPDAHHAWLTALHAQGGM
jgi:hypothetical protein